MTKRPVCISTKCWERDYTTVLTPEGIDELFGPFPEAAERQVVLNRVRDRRRAEELAEALLSSGKIDRFTWAEDHWPGLAARLSLPESWFGDSWPYSVPELCELDIAQCEVVLHLAGDVRFEAPSGWIDEALSTLGEGRTSVVSATPPAGAGWVTERGTLCRDGWVDTQLFSDQLFMVRRSEILRRDVLKSTHREAAKYPKPGGALTFEARVGAWLALSGRRCMVDIRTDYRHPVSGREGDTYHLTPPERPIVAFPRAGKSYPPPRSCRATGLVLSVSGDDTIGAAVSSLSWCESVLAVDLTRSPIAARTAELAGARVLEWEGSTRLELARRPLLSGIDGWVVELRGDQVCSGVLARRLASEIRTGGVAGLEAVCRARVGLHRQRPSRVGVSRSLVAYRTEGLTFSTAMDGNRPIPGGEIRRVRAKDGAVVEWLRAPDLRALVDAANERSSWRAENVVLDRPPSVRMPALRFFRSYFGGAWRYGSLGPQVAAVDTFEDWLMIQKWKESVKGGATAAHAEFGETARSVLSRDE